MKELAQVGSGILLRPWFDFHFISSDKNVSFKVSMTQMGFRTAALKMS